MKTSVPSASAPVAEILRELASLANPTDAVFLQGFFKTGPGQYGAGDVFRGIRVPVLRQLAKKHSALPMEHVRELLISAHHEDRLLALLILIRQYAKATDQEKAAVHCLYLEHTRYINNWDLVDVSAEHLVGAHLFGKSHSLLDRLARSPLLWERRIAILSTFHFIRRGEFDSTIRVAEQLLSDGEDLIHKAVGWLLREVGKRDRARLEAFLERHCERMPRTMLRYAIERLPEPQRQDYLRRGRSIKSA